MRGRKLKNGTYQDRPRAVAVLRKDLAGKWAPATVDNAIVSLYDQGLIDFVTIQPRTREISAVVINKIGRSRFHDLVEGH